MRPSQLTQQLNRAKSTNLVKPSETVNLKDKNQITQKFKQKIIQVQLAKNNSEKQSPNQLKKQVSKDHQKITLICNQKKMKDIQIFSKLKLQNETLIQENKQLKTYLNFKQQELKKIRYQFSIREQKMIQMKQQINELQLQNQNLKKQKMKRQPEYQPEIQSKIYVQNSIKPLNQTYPKQTKPQQKYNPILNNKNSIQSRVDDIIRYANQTIANYEKNLSSDNLKKLKEAEKQLQTAKDQLKKIESKNNQIYQKISHVRSILTKILCYLSRNKQQIQQMAQIPLAIYNSKQQVFYQQKIALLNTLAQYYERQYPNEAIKLYQQILGCQQRCFSLKDERTLVTLNNLACFLCENHKKGEALKYFLKGLKYDLKSSQIFQLFQKNMAYYKIKLQKVYQSKEIFLQWFFTPKSKQIQAS